MSHFDEMFYLLYIEGQLEREKAHELSEHVRGCESCRALLHVLQEEERRLRAALVEEDETIPARLLEPSSRAHVPWGWIVSFGLASGGAYSLWTGLVEPWQQQLDQAGFTSGNLLTMLFFSGAFWKGWSSMRTTMEFFALATMVLIVTAFLRRNWRRWTAIAVVLGGFAMLLGAPAPAAAAETHHGDPNYTLPAGETVKTDLFVFADATRVDGDVQGDLIAFSDKVTVSGHVTGDVIAFAGELRVDGKVDGNIRVGSHHIWLSGLVGKNISAWCGSIVIDPKAVVGGSMTFGAGDAELEGRIGRDLMAFAGNAELNGPVGGDVKARVGEMVIGPHASLAGKTVVTGHKQPRVDASAKLATPLEFHLEERHARRYTLRFFWHRILLWGVGFVYGLIMLLLMPGFFIDTTDACRKYAAAAGFGLLFLFATPIAAIIACVTIVGLAVGITTLLLYVMAVYSSTVFVAAWVGDLLLGPKAGVRPAIGRLALGLFILHILRVLPYVGGWILLVAVILGMGALVMAIYKRLRPQVAATAAAM